jgi:hypothetical protein
VVQAALADFVPLARVDVPSSASDLLKAHGNLFHLISNISLQNSAAIVTHISDRLRSAFMMAFFPSMDHQSDSFLATN